jgi:2-polyprenyl-3-methyl-5-hydroxy-6-metoxy-1,4-benzoquinol methylase
MDERQNNPLITYHLDHAARFEETLRRIRSVIKPGSLVADVGCHRLDFAKLLRDSGYEVVGFDVPEFLDKDSVRKRAQELGVRLVRIEDLGRGQFEVNVGEDQFSAMVFAEIIEHITFNPLEMWRALFEMMKPNSHLFVTTPNSMSLQGTWRGARRLLSRRGQGIDVSEIFSTVTFGHHWKEYSRQELVEYFSHLGISLEDIVVEPVQYERHAVPQRSGLKSVAKAILMSVDALKPDLFCTVRLGSVKPKVPESPRYLG